jgi:hypothetical protein
MFNPAGLGINLLVFQLVSSNRLAGVIKNHAAGAGRTLVYGGNVSGHIFPFSDCCELPNTPINYSIYSTGRTKNFFVRSQQDV